MLGVDGVVQVALFPGELVLAHGVKEIFLKEPVLRQHAPAEKVRAAGRGIAFRLSTVDAELIRFPPLLHIAVDALDEIGDVPDRLLSELVLHADFLLQIVFFGRRHGHSPPVGRFWFHYT